VLLKLDLLGTKVNDKRWGLNVITVDALNASVGSTTLTLDCITNYGPDGKTADTFGEASAVASWAEKVNIILGERRKMKEGGDQTGGGFFDKKTPQTSTITRCVKKYVELCAGTCGHKQSDARVSRHFGFKLWNHLCVWR